MLVDLRCAVGSLVVLLLIFGPKLYWLLFAKKIVQAAEEFDQEFKPTDVVSVPAVTEEDFAN